jgi:hypothetical protein
MIITQPGWSSQSDLLSRVLVDVGNDRPVLLAGMNGDSWKERRPLPRLKPTAKEQAFIDKIAELERRLAEKERKEEKGEDEGEQPPSVSTVKAKRRSEPHWDSSVSKRQTRRTQAAATVDVTVSPPPVANPRLFAGSASIESPSPWTSSWLNPLQPGYSHDRPQLCAFKPIPSYPSLIECSSFDVGRLLPGGVIGVNAPMYAGDGEAPNFSEFACTSVRRCRFLHLVSDAQEACCSEKSNWCSERMASVRSQRRLGPLPDFVMRPSRDEVMDAVRLLLSSTSPTPSFELVNNPPLDIVCTPLVFDNNCWCLLVVEFASRRLTILRMGTQEGQPNVHKLRDKLHQMLFNNTTVFGYSASEYAPSVFEEGAVAWFVDMHTIPVECDRSYSLFLCFKAVEILTRSLMTPTSTTQRIDWWVTERIDRWDVFHDEILQCAARWGVDEEFVATVWSFKDAKKGQLYQLYCAEVEKLRLEAATTTDYD